MPTDLSDIWWIGGVTCSGKSTLAMELATRSGRTISETDPLFDDHCHRANELDQPSMSGHNAWKGDVRELTVKEQAEVWRNFYRERFTFIRQDLEGMENGTVAVGVDLLPDVLEGIDPFHAVWLIPTRAFFERHYYTRDFVDKTSGDETVWEYYRYMIDHHRRQAGDRIVEPDGDISVEVVADEVMQFFL